ncbi:hypothetical protein ALC56_06242 [Trachymyrmex septentrionalis]|uniref:Uncharacterized protein n=1 Tax=Trachymyrmex septentrionalis TaxID=34720 RepID=A0A151JX05_9HYME|nr:hypothetical protein ALC56_06242 [Trachymyrmex septentrionalis]
MSPFVAGRKEIVSQQEILQKVSQTSSENVNEEQSSIEIYSPLSLSTISNKPSSSANSINKSFTTSNNCSSFINMKAKVRDGKLALTLQSVKESICIIFKKEGQTKDTQKDISNDMEKVQNNVEEVSKSVSALSTKMSNEIQRGITDLRQQMHNMATKEMLETNEIQRGRDMIVRALQDTQKDISNDVEKVRNNVEEVSKSVNALLTKVSNEIHQGVTDLRQQMNNMVTKETIEKSFKTTGRDMLVLALQKVSNEIQHLNRGVTDLHQQMNNMVTKETLEKSFKMTGKDMIVNRASDSV